MGEVERGYSTGQKVVEEYGRVETTAHNTGTIPTHIKSALVWST